MKTLQESTDIVARKRQYVSMLSIATLFPSELFSAMTEAAELYAQQFKDELSDTKSEIVQLKDENKELQENYDGMTRHCRYLTEINVFNMGFDKADARWREQHKVEEGEDFISWYMRYHAAERSADSKEISKLKQEKEELHKQLEKYKNPLRDLGNY